MLRESLERQKLSSAEIVLLEGVQNGTHRLHAIIDDMIDVSLIDNNLMQMNFQPVWLNRLFSVLQKRTSPDDHRAGNPARNQTFPGQQRDHFCRPGTNSAGAAQYPDQCR
jgi:signal transduction histidine kinase